MLNSSGGSLHCSFVLFEEDEPIGQLLRLRRHRETGILADPVGYTIWLRSTRSKNNLDPTVVDTSLVLLHSAF